MHMLKGRERELAYLNKEYQSGSDRLLAVSYTHLTLPTIA